MKEMKKKYLLDRLTIIDQMIRSSNRISPWSRLLFWRSEPDFDDSELEPGKGSRKKKNFVARPLNGGGA